MPSDKTICMMSIFFEKKLHLQKKNEYLNSLPMQIPLLNKNRIILLIVFILVIIPASSQNLEPRAYGNVPKNLNVIAIGYGFIDGNVLTDPSLPIANFIIRSHNIGLGYVHTFGLANKLARIQVTIPYVFVDGSIEDTYGGVKTGSRNGFGDAKIRFGFNLLGSPALETKDFKNFEQKTILGVSLVTSIPTGNYYGNKKMNIGANRWAFKPEIGISKRFRNLYAEFYTGVWFYTQNNDYFVKKELTQQPTFSFQAHASYYFKNKMWIGFNSNWFVGGRSIIDDISQDSQLDNWRVGGIFSTPITKNQSIKLQFHVGAFTNKGLSYDEVTLNYQYSFF
ncbi:transporter [Flavobacterium sp. LHD-80]|uniref:transporter n=1 Tax=Flavobacterium sp. LHD-80 TaxID=3071411 RepID=UPI0027E129C1|nr:transporter [Flavobacterium sp. LHD-80]MDQ6473084.1 transporter [Flavobacterium sp. LHD-80]